MVSCLILKFCKSLKQLKYEIFLICHKKSLVGMKKLGNQWNEEDGGDLEHKMIHGI